MNGCVEQVLKDGVVVAERRRFDNRLSMAMLTRLDRLAESQTGEEAEQLRALSEDFDDYLDVLESGGDEQAFLEARRPREGAGNPSAGRKALPPGDRGGRAPPANPSDWSLVDPAEIPVDGLDPNRMSEWTADQHQRAELSHYLDWLDEIVAGEGPVPNGRECPAAFDRYRREIEATAELGRRGRIASFNFFNFTPDAGAGGQRRGLRWRGRPGQPALLSRPYGRGGPQAEGLAG